MPPDDRLERAKANLDQVAAGEVRSAPHQTVPASPATPDMDEVAFEGEVYRYCADWLNTNGSKIATARPFAFILSRSISQDLAQLKATLGGSKPKQYHAFKSQTLVDVQGQVCLTTMNLEYAVLIPVENVTQAQHLFEAIQKFGLADRQIAVFEPPHSNLILLRKGLQSPSRKQTVKASGTAKPWTLLNLEKEIAQFHDDQTRTPTAAMEPWFSAKKGITGEKLEIRISKQLAHYLDLMWQRGHVLAEAGTHSGRMDIFVTSEVLEPGLGPCVIEVKVLRSRGSHEMPPTHAERWAMKGVIQAKLYRDDKQAPTAYLCCFDARDAETSLPTVDALAKTHNVEHRKFYMHRSADSLQSAELAKSGIDA